MVTRTARFLAVAALGLGAGAGPAAAVGEQPVRPGEAVTIPVAALSKILVSTCGDGRPHSGPTYSTFDIVPRGAAALATAAPGVAEHLGGTAATQITISPTATPRTIIIANWTAVSNGCFSLTGTISFVVVGPPGGGSCTTADVLAGRNGCTEPCDDTVSAGDLAETARTSDDEARTEIERRSDREAAAARRGDRAAAKKLLNEVRDLQADRARTSRRYEDLLGRKLAAGGCGMSEAQLAALADAIRKRAELARRLAEMERAVQELRDRNDVFCAVSGGMLEVPTKGLPEPVQTAVGDGWDNVCGRIPRLIESHVDADAKMEAVRAALAQLDALIAELRAGAPLEAARASRAAAPTRLLAAPANPLATLAGRRAQALRAMRAVTRELRQRDLAGAQQRALTAAAALGRVPAARAAARRYLARNGLGRVLVSRASLPALRRAATRRALPPAIRAWAARKLGTAEARRRLVHASVVPAASIGPMRASELVASPRLDALDRALAAAYRSFASTP